VVNITGSNAVLPNRPMLDARLDPARRTPSRTVHRLRGDGRLQREHADDAGSTSTGSSAAP
jgi:hypothetical protein